MLRASSLEMMTGVGVALTMFLVAIALALFAVMFYNKGRRL